MTNAPELEPSAIERLKRRVGRTAFVAVVTGLAGGLGLFLLGQPAASAHLLAATFALLVVLPIVNVVAVLAEEIQRRDWAFAVVAAAVLGLVVYNVVDRVYRSLG